MLQGVKSMSEQFISTLSNIIFFIFSKFPGQNLRKTENANKIFGVGIGWASRVTANKSIILIQPHDCQ
jgi:hypothetical protein